MKRIVLLLLAASWVSTASASEEPRSEISGSFNYFQTQDDLSWDDGAGAEAQARYWITDNFGLALSVGGANWDSPTQIFGQKLDPFTTEAFFAEGDALLIPLGGSALLRYPVSGGLKISLEAGIRYVVVDSNIELEAFGIADTFGNAAFAPAEGDVEIDDGLVGFVGLQADYSFNNRFSLFGGVGYQFDIQDSDVEVKVNNIGDIPINESFETDSASFESLVFQIGGSLAF